MPSIKYGDLEMAMGFVSDSYLIDCAAYINRTTGKIYWESSELDEEFEVPDDVSDESLYATVPTKQELDLGKRLALRFTDQEIPDHLDQVYSIFRHKGAYSRFKDLLENHGLLEKWYKFEASAIETALRQWAEEEGFEVEPAASQNESNRIYQVKITLKGITPAIWRRIQVPDFYNFWGLHVAIQDAMGWLDYHLHAFRFYGKNPDETTEIGIPVDSLIRGDSEIRAGWETPISDFFDDVGTRAFYEYDFGDGWLHEIVLEGILLRETDQKYPMCIDGENACPPEDCGGVPGYARLLEALSDPGNEEYEEMLEWLGGNYEPKEFKPGKVRFDDPKKRWKKAFS